MNSSTSEAVWPSPVAAHQTAQNIANTQETLLALVATDIIAAVSSGLFTCTVSTSGATSQDVQYVMALLNQGGYRASVDSSGLEVSW